MLGLHKLSIAYPNQIWLPITEEIQQKSWQRSQQYSNPTSRCQAYLNDICWQIFIPWLEAWLEEDGKKIELLNPQYYPELWEFVNGSIIKLDRISIVLIPYDSIDLEELDIPQEWVEIPEWQADYYLAIQVNFDVSDEPWIRIRGYVSKQQLKEKGEFEQRDRIYYINQKYLEEDITEILLSIQILADKKPELVTPVELSQKTVNKLLDKLGSSSVFYPRLAIHFDQWKLLITNFNWRQKLFKKRTQPTQDNISYLNLRERLSQVADKVEESWQTVENLFLLLESIPTRGFRNPEETITKDAIKPLIRLLAPNNPEKERTQAAGVLGKIGKGHPEVIEALIELLHTAKEEETKWQAALSLGKIAPDNSYGGIEKGKIIDLGIDLGNQKIALIVAIMPQSQDRVGVWIKLKPISKSIKLPPHLQLDIISQGKTILAAKTRSNKAGKGKDRYLQLRFTPPSQTHFQVQVTLNNSNFTEYFEV